MKSVLFLLLVNLFVLPWSVHADPIKDLSENKTELERMLTELAETSQARDLIEGTGVRAEALKRQERRRAREIAQFFRNFPHFLTFQSGELASRWFHQLPSRQLRYQWIFHQFLGYQVLTTSDRQEIFKRLKNWGLEAQFRFRFIQEGRIGPRTGETVSFKRWVVQTGLAWIDSQNKMLEQGRPREFARVLDPLLMGIHNAGYSAGIYHFFVANQPLDLRFKILNYLLDHKIALVKVAMIGHTVKDISIRDWIRHEPDLFRKFIRVVEPSKMSVERFVAAYGTREFLLGTFNIFPTESVDGRAHIFTERGEGFKTGEQLMLLSERFQAQILTQVVNNQNSDWAVELLRFAVEQGFTSRPEMGRALGESSVMQDARWAQWMLALDRGVFADNIDRYIRESVLYQQTSQEALEVHRLILRAAVEKVVNKQRYGPGELDPLDYYLSRAMGHPLLFKEVLFPLLSNVFSNYQPAIWKRFLERVVMPVQFKPEIRNFLLDFIYEHRINDLEVLRLLNRAFGVPASFEADLNRARNQDIELELRQMAFDQIYFEGSQGTGALRCQSIYAP